MTTILIGEIFKELAQIQEDIGNLNMSVTAQHLALADLVPGFESRYLERMGCARVLELKSECERRIQERVAVRAKRILSISFRTHRLTRKRKPY